MQCSAIILQSVAKTVGLRQYIRDDVIVSQLDRYTDKDSRLDFYIQRLNNIVDSFFLTESNLFLPPQNSLSR